MNTNLRIEFSILPFTYTPISGRIDGIENFSITYREDDENGDIARSFSSELTFYDDGYQYIKQNLIDPSNGFFNQIGVRIWDACCEKPVFIGKIRGDSIDWCENDCYVSCNVIEDKTVVDCISSKLIWDNQNGFLNRDFTPIEYCLQNRPLFIQVLLDFVSQLLSAIVTYVLTIIRFLVSIFSSSAGQDIKDLIDTINGYLLPCGSYHPSPYIRDYIKNVCDICGLTFQSSILNNPNSSYYNAVLFAAQVKRGYLPTDTSKKLINANKPLETLKSLFNGYLNTVFNAKYKIRNNTLVFERKDYFNTGNQWIDIEYLQSQGRLVDNKVCYNWIDKGRWAFGRFEYQGDAMEYIGNEYRPYYNDIVEWNSPPSPAQSGEYVVSLPLSPARFVGDAESNALDLTYSGNFPGILLMAQHTCFNYKFLIINPLLNKVPYYFPDSAIGGAIPGTRANERYNYPFWFKEDRKDNLYSNFHYIDNPRLPQNVNFDFKFTFQFTCQEFADFEFGKNVRLIRGGQEKFGQIKEIQVDFNKRTIQVTGVVN